MKKHIEQYTQRLKKALTELENDEKFIQKLTNELNNLVNSENKLIVAGNGGSAATSSHLACDFQKTFLGKKPRENNKRINVLCLNDNIPLLTAWANDEGYEYVFSEQLKNVGRKGDVLIVITGSGNSKNILNVLEVAKKMHIKTYSWLGFEGGIAKSMSDNNLIVRSDDYGVIEDVHMVLVHLITDYFKKQLK